jgi:hypothetical protein
MTNGQNRILLLTLFTSCAIASAFMFAATAEAHQQTDVYN